MKFLQFEYKSLVSSIEELGFQESDFSFVKKRGKLNVNHISSDATFYFFRKTEMVLNTQRQWEKKLEYKFGAGEEDIFSEEWDAVLNYFKNWLTLLK